MPINRLFIFAFLFGSIFFEVSFAQTEGMDSDEPLSLSYHIIDLSGLVALNQYVRDTSQQIITEEQLLMSRQYYWVDQLAIHWTPNAWHHALNNLLDRWSIEQQRQLFELFSSSVIKEIRLQEVNALDSWTKNTPLGHLSTEKHVLIERLNDATHFSKLLVGTRGYVYRSYTSLTPQWLPPKDWKSDTHQHAIDFLMLAHKATSVDDLRTYIYIYEQSVIRAFLEQVLDHLASL